MKSHERRLVTGRKWWKQEYDSERGVAGVVCCVWALKAYLTLIWKAFSVMSKESDVSEQDLCFSETQNRLEQANNQGEMFHLFLGFSSWCRALIMIIWACLWQRQAPLLDVNGRRALAPCGYIAACFAAATCSSLVQYWTYFKDYCPRLLLKYKNMGR